MNNYVAVIEYDGSNYKGFQYQPGKIKTIQDELQKALSILLGKSIFKDFSYSGRTDTGVHAKYQVINFKTDKFLDLYKFKWQLNCLLPEDIVAKDIRLTDEHFDSRKDAKLREYSYFVVNNDFQSAFLKKYSLLVTKRLDVQMMRKAAEMFVGTFDFRSFCSSNFQAGSTIRRIYGFKIRCFSDGLIVFKIEASSFLYNMVRIIIGTILEAGRGKRNLESIDKALKGASRKLAGKIVPAKGLFLTKVIY